MKLLMVIDSLVGAGAQKQFANLAIGLQARNHQVCIFIYHPAYDFLPDIEKNNIEVIFCQKHSRFDITPLKGLCKEIRQRKPDVVISFLRTPSIYAELVRLVNPKFKLIVSERITAFEGKLTTSDILSGLLHTIASKVTSNSQDYKNLLIKKLPHLTKKTDVIYNGTDQKFFSAYTKNNDTPSTTTVHFAVVAARCTEVKGAMILAKALFHVVASEQQDVAINWIGPINFEDGYVQSVIKYLANNNLTPNWHWSGKSSDVAQTLMQHNALISASLHEGVSNAMCEAMAMGLPVIVSDISDNSIILKNETFGYIFESANSEQLSEKMLAFIALSDADRTELAQAAHARAIELFSVERFADDWEALCHSLVKPDNDHTL